MIIKDGNDSFEVNLVEPNWIKEIPFSDTPPPWLDGEPVNFVFHPQPHDYDEEFVEILGPYYSTLPDCSRIEPAEFCPVCNEQYFQCPSGIICKNGHQNYY